jgi:hypothetical protein
MGGDLVDWNLGRWRGRAGGHAAMLVASRVRGGARRAFSETHKHALALAGDRSFVTTFPLSPGTKLRTGRPLSGFETAKRGVRIS